MTLQLGILVSGNGTNLQAIIDATQKKELEAKVSIVISDKPQAFALERARKHGIATEVILRKNFQDKSGFENEILKKLKEKNVEWVVLAGFMRLLSSAFIQQYPDRILNIHPALLPAFPGLNAIAQAFDHKAKETGCTVHLVDEGCDTGPIVAQRRVPIEAHDTLDTLTQKVHQEEHRLYPEVLRCISEGRLKIKGRKVFIK